MKSERNQPTTDQAEAQTGGARRPRRCRGKRSRGGQRVQARRDFNERRQAAIASASGGSVSSGASSTPVSSRQGTAAAALSPTAPVPHAAVSPIVLPSTAGVPRDSVAAIGAAPAARSLRRLRAAAAASAARALRCAAAAAEFTAALLPVEYAPAGDMAGGPSGCSAREIRNLPQVNGLTQARAEDGDQ